MLEKTKESSASGGEPSPGHPIFPLVLGIGHYGIACGCALDAKDRPCRFFRDLGELLVYMGRTLRNEDRGTHRAPQYFGRPIRCRITVLYRQNGSFQGILDFHGQKYPFRSGMELLYLLREAADCTAVRSAKEMRHAQGQGRSNPPLPAG
jgi:hypothetical protein